MQRAAGSGSDGRELLTTGEQVLGMVTRVFTVLKTSAPSSADRPPAGDTETRRRTQDCRCEITVPPSIGHITMK